MDPTGTININDLSKHLLTMTELRRRPGEVFQKLPQIGMYIVWKNGEEIGRIFPPEEKQEVDIKKNLEKLEKLVGGFHFGKGLTPSQLN
ncbi:hypothetical protein HY085_00735, partial [Candidatus Gottesmanbacteria bacterium]|nr:hypothetical protein [Candidatus Gottesmanbacteria bacterium]